MRGSSRLLSGLAAAAFALLIVGLGGWWFTLSLGVIVHLALLEFFRLAQFKGIRPASKTTLVACQLLLIITQLAPGSPWAAAVLPVAGSVICGWLLLQPISPMVEMNEPPITTPLPSSCTAHSATLP